MVSEIARQTSLGLDKEWTPALAMPSPTGMLCWARPAGTVTDGHLLPPVNEVSWDSIWWWSRPDGALQLHPASRNTAKAQAMFGVRSPLWTAHTIIVDPNKKPRTDEVVGSPAGPSVRQRARRRVAVDGAGQHI
jgi:hypothetical protein